MKIPSSNFEDITKPSDGTSLHVESTSAVTADVSPIILSQSETDVTRTLFQPTFVADNPHGSEKCLEGKLIYEKRSKGDTYPTQKVSPRAVKVGEIMELPLDTSATFKLFQSLNDLYSIYQDNGIPYGRSSFKRVDSSFKDFLDIIQNDPSAARLIGVRENFELVKILLQLITNSDSTESLSNALQNLREDNLSQLSESISFERINRAIAIIEENLDNSREEFWQSEVFKENQWVLAQIFSCPCTIFQDKAYVGGKSISNRNGNVCDFIYQNRLTNNVILIEIKTPNTKIIYRDYRDTFSFTTELSGAVNQVIHYRDSLMNDYNNLHNSSAREFTAFNPRCVVIIGKIADMDKQQVGAFESYRNSLNNIEIITFDEILQRLKDMRAIFSSEGEEVFSDSPFDEEMDDLPF
jgi:hypothetical protein